MLLEVLLGEVLEVSLGEADVGLDSDALVVSVHLHTLSEVAGSAADLDLRNSAKLLVLKTLSSTGFEQSMVKECETLASVCSFLAILAVLATLGYCVAIFNLLNDRNNIRHY